MDPILAGVASAALAEGVKFLYQQAGEILSSWRARRRDKSAAPPRTLPSPPSVTVGHAKPLAEAPDAEALEALQLLKDQAEPIKDGDIAVTDPAAREAIADLRAVVEAALQAPIHFAGEPERPSRISDIKVVAKDVVGRVTGVRAKSGDISDVSVKAETVKGDVTGVDLT